MCCLKELKVVRKCLKIAEVMEYVMCFAAQLVLWPSSVSVYVCLAVSLQNAVYVLSEGA